MSPAEHGPVRQDPAELGLLEPDQPASVQSSQPPSEGRLLRFALVERLAHWTYAAFFLLALVIGLLMWIPRTRIWMAGSRQAISHLHAGMGILMIVLPLLLFLLVNRRQLARDLREIDLWDSDDREWFWRALRGCTLLRREMPPQDRFNAGQKANSIFVLTGSLLLAGPQLPAWLVSRALVLHQVLAVAGIALFAGHLLHVLSTRHGRDSLRAMTGGTMSETVARERHEKWWRRQKE
jgi:formate dehydrogenase subunit gamma